MSVRLSRTEIIAIQDEAKAAGLASRSAAVRERSKRIVDWLDAAVDRRRAEVAASLTPNSDSKEKGDE
jgi:hypothetical protein